MGVYALSGVRFRKAVFLLGTVVLCLWASTWGIIPMAVCAVVSYFCGRFSINSSAAASQTKKDLKGYGSYYR